MTDNHYQEWLKRKAKRIAYQARYATQVKQFTHKVSGRVMKVLMAERSHGYQSNYKPVPTYYLLVYDKGELIHGQRMTQGEWRKQEPEFARICSEFNTH